jgi:arylsulfatase A-like enzyme
LTPRHVAILAAASFFLLPVGCHRVRPAPARVLLITLDTTRADHLGCYGRKEASTPVLDGLAKEGFLFTDASSPVSCTLPSHSTLFTGLYPTATGVRYNITFRLGPGHVTLAERFHAAGFQTAAFPAAYSVAKPFGLDQGFDLYDYPEEAREPSGSAGSWERSAGEGVDRALAWLGARGQAKVFVWLHIFDAHYPYRPPFPYSDQFRSSPYDGEIAYADHELGRLFDELRRKGLWDDTLVVVAGDHGEGLYDHREAQHSLLAYQSTIHVPLLMKVPGFRSGVQIHAPVTLADVAPTLIDLCGLDAGGEKPQGVTLRPALLGGTVPPRSLYFEALGGSLIHGWSSIEGIREGRFKLIDSVKPELYDLDRDPEEKDNVIGLEQARAAELGKALADMKAAITVTGATADAPDLTPDARARLASLGYVGGSGGGGAAQRGPAPQDLIYLSTDLSRLQVALGASEWTEAAELSAYLLQKDPTGRFAMYARAMALANLDQGGAALRAVDELLSKYSDSPDIFDLKGEILVELRRNHEAAEVFGAARKSFPDSESLAYHEALARYESGERDSVCRTIVPEALTKIRQKGRLLILRARCEVAAGDDSAALATLRAAVNAGLGQQVEKLEQLPEFRALVGKPGFPSRPAPR